jgi:hypothetical protein
VNIWDDISELIIQQMMRIRHRAGKGANTHIVACPHKKDLLSTMCFLSSLCHLGQFADFARNFASIIAFVAEAHASLSSKKRDFDRFTEQAPAKETLLHVCFLTTHENGCDHNILFLHDMFSGLSLLTRVMADRMFETQVDDDDLSWF